jgi:hypothetical protein
MSNIYFDTFSATLVATVERAAELKAVLLNPTDLGSLCEEPLNYGHTRSRGFALESYKGKLTKKFFQVVISRLDSGKYELTTYVL